MRGDGFCFQAEDGIRVKLVTGVQTCALPIYSLPPRRRQRVARGSRAGPPPGHPSVAWVLHVRRSEECRVGKERSSRRAHNGHKKTTETHPNWTLQANPRVVVAWAPASRVQVP